jgi:O-antigen/teichoic acid export membrane protein
LKEATTLTREAHVTIRNISTVAILKFAQYPFLALSMVLVPRMMGAEQYGEYALVISIITVAWSIIDFGASAELFGRFVPELQMAKRENLISKLFSNVVGMRLVLGMAAALVLFPILTATYSDRFNPLVFIIIGLVVLMREVEMAPYALLYGLNKLGQQSAQLPMRRAFSLVMILIMYSLLGFVGAILSTLIVDILLTVIGFIWTRTHLSLSDLKPDVHFMKPYLAFDAVFFLSAVMLNVWQRSGNLLIERLTGDTQQVALFDLPNQAYIVTTIMIFVAIDSLVPMFTNLLLTGREQKLTEWSMVISKYTAVLAALIFWAFAFLGIHIAPLVLGQDYVATVPNGMWLLAGLFPMAITQLGFVFSVSYKKPWRYFVALCCSFVVFLGASFLLIPQYGAVGCSIATFVSSIVSAAVLYVSHQRRLGNSILYGLLALGLSGVYAPFLFLRSSLGVDTLFLVVGSALYAGLLFLLRVVRRDEITRVLQSLRPRANS